MTSTTTTELRTANESVSLLTGFEEIGIEQKFGKDIDNLRFTMALRALVFTDRRRAGSNVSDAYKYAMSLSLKEINTCFADEPDDHLETCEACGQKIPEDAEKDDADDDEPNFTPPPDEEPIFGDAGKAPEPAAVIPAGAGTELDTPPAE